MIRVARIFLYSLLVTLLSFYSLKAQQVLTTNFGHTGNVVSLSYSADGQYLVSGGGRDKSVKLWSVEAGKEIRSINMDEEVKDATLSPDGETIAIAYGSTLYNGGISIYSAETGQRLATKTYKKTPIKVVFSEDGRYIVAGGWEGRVMVYDSRLRSLIRSMDQGKSIWALAVSSDSKYIVAGDRNNLVKLWSLSNGKLLKTLSHSGIVNTVAFSPENVHFASGADDKIVKVWTVKGKRPVKTLSLGKGVDAIAFSKDGQKMIAGGHRGLLKAWSTSTWTELVDYDAGRERPGRQYVYALAVSPDNRHMVAGGIGGPISMWDANSGEMIPRFETKMVNRNNRSIMSPRGNTLITGNLGPEKHVKIFDFPSGRITRKFDEAQGMSAAEYSPDGQYLAYSMYGGNKVVLRSTQDHQTVREFPQDTIVRHLRYGPNGRYLLTGENTNAVKLFDISSGRLIKSFKPHAYRLHDIVFSHDGKYFATSGLGASKVQNDKQNTVNIWETATQRLVRGFVRDQTTLVVALGFSPDNRYLITSGADKELKFWNIQTGSLSKSFKGHTNWAYALDVNVRKNEILSGSNDNTLKIWDLNGRVKRTLKGHTAALFSASYTPSGKYIVSGGKDGTSRFWDANTGKLLATMYQFIRSDDFVVISPDGRFDGTEGAFESLYYVEGRKILPLSSLYEQFYTPNLLARSLEGEQFEIPKVQLTNLKPAPTVSITNPSSGSKLNNNQVTVSIRAVDQGGGVDEIRLYHNGKLVSTTQRGFKSAGQTKDFTISLVSGANRFKATAFNDQRTESLPDEITVYYEGAKATADLFLMVVGINQYRNPAYSLNYALTDASAFKNTIESGASTIFSNISTTYIKDADATKSNILNALNGIKSKAGPEDMFVFYYAGHGVMNAGDMGYNKDFYLVPTDVTKLYGADDMLAQKAISSKEMTDLSQGIAAQKQLFVLDACQSGGAIQQIASRGAAEEKAIAQLARSTGTYWLTASGSEQFATEFQQLGHGVFTYAILEGLKGNADGGDRKITAKELGAFIEDKVPELTEQYKGQAQFPRSYGFGQDFPLVIVK